MTLTPAEDSLTLPPDAAVCDGYRDVSTDGTVRSNELNEISGVAASRNHPGVLWVHNDSGGEGAVYALSVVGELLATWTLNGAGAFDWEDLATGPGPNPELSYLYIGDIGDNLGFRPTITVYRFAEPDTSTDGTVTHFETFRLTYPEGHPDAEALAVDPASGDLIIVTKDRDGPEIVFLARANELADNATTLLKEVARLDLGSRAQVTAADFSPAGERVALRGYNRIWIWPRTAGDIAETFVNEPCRATSPDEVQGESLTFGSNGVSIYTLSEGRNSPIHRIRTQE